MEIKNFKGETLLTLEANTLSDADLSDADLSGADLRRADLSGANLRRADLRRADLSGANLRRADLYGADLYGANLRRADLYGADLYGANLSGADLSGADLSGANLRRADLYGADLSGANLSDIRINEGTFGVTTNCPDEGSFIGYKKCRNDVIVKLLIPEDALRSSAASYKCRCSKAKVIDISGGEKVAYSIKDVNFIYIVGETVEVENFDTDRWNECSTGIHFFMSKLMAEQYE